MSERRQESVPARTPSLPKIARVGGWRQALGRQLETEHLLVRKALSVVLSLLAAEAIVQWTATLIGVFIVNKATYDFSYYYDTALVLRDNRFANAYNPAAVAAAIHMHHVPIDPTIHQFVLYYPLLFPILFIPLTLLPFLAAARVWMIFNTLLWAANTVLLIDLLLHALPADMPRRQADESKHDTAIRPSSLMLGPIGWWRGLTNTRRFVIALALFVSLTYEPMLQAVSLGQASPMILSCVLLTPWLIRRGHPAMAGAILMFGTLIEIVPVVMVIYYLIQRRWRVVVGAVACFAVLISGMTLVVGIPGLLSMRAILLLGNFESQEFHNEALSKVPQWIAIALGGHPSQLTTLVGYGLVALVALGFGAGLVALWRARNNSLTRQHAGTQDHQDLIGYGWAVATMILVSPISWEHHFIWLLPTIVLCLGYAVERLGRELRDPKGVARPTIWVVLATVLGFAMTMNNLPFGYDGLLTLSPGPYVLGHPLRPWFMLLRPTGAVLVWLASAVLLFSRHQDSPGANVSYTAEPGRVQLSQSLVAQQEIADHVLLGTVICLLVAIIVVRTAIFEAVAAAVVR